MKPKVFYNNECLVCKIEINHYKKISENFEWKEIHKLKNIAEEINVKPNKLIRRLHVIHNNKILIGVDAFILIWSKIPRYKYLSKFIKLPIIYHLAIIIYEILAFILYIKNYKHINKISH